MNTAEYPLVRMKLTGFLDDADKIYRNEPASDHERLFKEAMKNHGMEP